MSLMMTAINAKKLDDGLWKFEMPPHQVQRFASGIPSIGANSVLLIRGAIFDPATSQLQFAMDDVSALNVGSGTTTVGISAEGAKPNESVVTRLRGDAIDFSPGDQQFLRYAKRYLTDEMYEAALLLLARVRERTPGELKKGKTKNFSDTPDNFWYVIVQSRLSELSITVRGSVEHFKNIAQLEIKDDRGNTRFKVRSIADVPAALDLIFHAHRKR